MELGSKLEVVLNSAFKKPKPSGSRVVAFELLTEVNRNGAFANIKLPELLEKSGLEQRDRAFATELGYGALRMQGKHDFGIRSKIDRPFEELDSKIVDLLRLGLHQIYEMRVPNHAAVGETVELARFVAGESKGSYVNALLRSITSDSDLYERAFAGPDLTDLEKMSIQYSHPEWIISAYFDQLKDWEEVKALLAINNLPVAPHLVAWPGKSTVEELQETGGEILPWSRFGLISDHQPMEYSAIVDRRAGVQDLGSQLIAQVFYDTHDYSPSESWLDMCAGPGGKAALLFNLLETQNHESTFLANEPTPHRADLVARVVPRAKVISHDGRDSQSFGRTFDRILVDAPCTGLGALRRRPEARWRRSMNDLKELVPLQRDLIDSAYRLLNPGGLLAYATCSPHIAETIAQVLDVQYRHKDLELIPATKFGSPAQCEGKIPGTVQMWTHRDGTDAMFMAIFQKREV